MSVMDTPLTSSLDLQAAISPSDTRSQIAQLVSDFVGLTSSGALSAAQVKTAELADPIIAALEYEGSAELGNPWCQSDFPTKYVNCI